jgi:hypothetical protein
MGRLELASFLTQRRREAPLLRDEEGVLRRLEDEVELTKKEARTYLGLLKGGYVPREQKSPEIEKLIELGMIILSGDNSRFVPVHPRLAVANHYRTWREELVKQMTERRMRVDRLILELIPLYEALNDRKLVDNRNQR